MRLSDLVTELGGILKGEDRVVSGASTLEEASSDEITFLANPKYRDRVKTSRAGAIIVAREIETAIPQIITEDPYLYFARVVSLVYPDETPEPGISPLAFIHPDASVDAGACIYPHVYV
ncbi:MAG: LpxD N-terminal domain-containing protein, partial [Desulfomonilia bacterium]|nr:LpxD N-terminal domain-containing protein [Desulfomonilia bacterium]